MVPQIHFKRAQNSGFFYVKADTHSQFVLSIVLCGDCSTMYFDSITTRKVTDLGNLWYWMCSVFYAGSLVDCFLLSRVSLPAFSQVMRVWIFFVSKFLSDSCGSILGDLLIHWTYSEASSVPGIVLGIGESKIKSRGPPSRAHGSSCQTERTICVDDCTGAPARAFSVGKRAGSLAELFRALRCFISLTQSFLSFLFYRSRIAGS